MLCGPLFNGTMEMSYRPRIPDDVHERVELNYIGNREHQNRAYINAVTLLINEDGDYHEWFRLLSKYCKKSNQDELKVLNQIMSQVLDEDGEPDIKFKQQLELEGVENTNS